MTAAADPDSERLISQMLVDDLSFLEDQAAAEAFQIAHMMASSKSVDEDEQQPIDMSHDLTLTTTEMDLLVALRSVADDSMEVADAAYAQSIYNESDAEITRDYQAALKVAAEERRTNLDHAFALRLEAVRDAGTDDTDIEMMKDADQVLGKAAVENIFAEDLNSKGKERGKGKNPGEEEAEDPTPPAPTSIDDLSNAALLQLDFDQSDQPRLLKCGICQEPFLQTKNPYNAAQTPNSSNRISFGQVFPCPGAHGYCIDCTTSYLRSKLEDGGSDRIVFPIRCPECSPLIWQMDDDTAASVLTPDLLEVWHHQKLLESIPKFWCPAARCSELIATDDEMEGVQAACPSCQTQICVACRSTWHNDLTCEEYQDLPENERMPEDRAVLELARAENWRRCPSCHVIVELTQGCNHMICACKFEFCFRCLSDWKGKCTSVPACALFDEEMLLNQRDRGQPRAAAAPPLVVNIPPQAPAVRLGQFRYQMEDDYSAQLSWVGIPGSTKTGHAFTGAMVRGLTCGYCNARLNSLRDLRLHLANPNQHPVYACCGKFFKTRSHYDQHCRSIVRTGHRNNMERAQELPQYYVNDRPPWYQL
ncbi:hypothetical protein FRB93_010821 [Tulasnella sp. JGI-2019a]|nr:hypothetical protein FRB93_010821 [Tulasnella sp. JGI-2019a]